jgi:PilZ domain
MIDAESHSAILADLRGFASERRREARASAPKFAKLVIGEALFSRDCTILNLSLHGACVRVSRIVKLTPPIGLLLVEDALLFDAEIAWRVGDEVGLSFNSRCDLLDEVEPAQHALRLLWAELLVQRRETDTAA